MRFQYICILYICFIYFVFSVHSLSFAFIADDKWPKICEKKIIWIKQAQQRPIKTKWEGVRLRNLREFSTCFYESTHPPPRFASILSMVCQICRLSAVNNTRFLSISSTRGVRTMLKNRTTMVTLSMIFAI